MALGRSLVSHCKLPAVLKNKVVFCSSEQSCLKKQKLPHVARAASHPSANQRNLVLFKEIDHSVSGREGFVSYILLARTSSVEISPDCSESEAS